MANSDEKISKFVQAITSYAEEQSRKIHQEVEDFKAERLKEAERKVLADVYQLIHREQAELHNEMSREMSRRELAARQKLIGRRSEMMASVFRDAAERLREYTASAEYPGVLRRSVAETAERLPADGTVFYLSAADMEKHAAALRDVCPAGSSLAAADDIRIGGVRAVNQKAGLLIDDTLDSKLDLQRDWFTRESGLTVE